jgi:hypothetical protein
MNLKSKNQGKKTKKRLKIAKKAAKTTKKAPCNEASNKHKKL